MSDRPPPVVVFLATDISGNQFTLSVPHTITIGQLSQALGQGDMDHVAIDHITLLRNVMVKLPEAEPAAPPAAQEASRPAEGAL